MKDVNQYQTDLYRLGVELVHVFGKGWGSGFKNAVDVKMAVDAIAAISSLPHVDTFVIVSGDRDFIHVLKALRRHGKTVVGVSPASSVSHDFAALCDRFVKYEDLAVTYEVRSAAAEELRGDVLDQSTLREALASLIADNPRGIKGAMIKPLLRRKLSPSFDESAYGFSRLSDLLYAMQDVVRVEAPDTGGDIVVFPAHADATNQLGVITTPNRAERLIRQSGLSFYRYERNATLRRRILSALFRAMREREPFAWVDVQERLLRETSDWEPPLSITVMSKYRTIIYQGRGFVFEPNQDALPQRERLARLREDIDSESDLVRLYEASIVYKVAGTCRDEPLQPEDVVELLGLDGISREEISYSEELIAMCESINGEASDAG
jgi:hypothetical protein